MKFPRCRQKHRLRSGIAASDQADSAAGAASGSGAPAPMRLFHLSIAYLTLLFAVIAVTALLPWGR